MKTDKNYAEKINLMVALTVGLGMLTMLVSMVVNLVFFKGSHPIWDSIAVVAALIFMLPFFIGQFALPAGLLERLGFQANIPFWGKAMFYILVFPFANMWMLAGVNALFHFLPDYHAAMMQGLGRDIVEAMRHESAIMALKIIAVAYLTAIFLGLITRALSKRLV